MKIPNEIWWYTTITNEDLQQPMIHYGPSPSVYMVPSDDIGAYWDKYRGDIGYTFPPWGIIIDIQLTFTFYYFKNNKVNWYISIKDRGHRIWGEEQGYGTSGVWKII